MKKMTLKKLLAVTCAAVLAFSMIGCSSKTEEAASEPAAKEAAASSALPFTPP